MLNNKEANRKRINKRGLTLLQFIVDLVIGIVCLIIILTLFSAILNIFFFANERQKAEATISRLAQYLQTTDEGQSINFLFYVPKGWWFVSISDGEYSTKLPFFAKLNQDRIDNKCKSANTNCICICRNGVGLWGLDCSSGRNSYCEVISRPFIKDNELFAFEIQLEALTIIKKKEAYFVDKVTEFQGATDVTSYTFEGLTLPETQNFNDGLENMKLKNYETIIESKAKLAGIEPALAKAIAIKENVPMDPTEISSSGAVGIMQIKPDTAGKSQEELFNPEVNIEAGVSEMARIKDDYLDGNLGSLLNIELLAMGYHDGPGVIKGNENYRGCKTYEFPSSSKCERYTWYLSDAAKKESINYPRVVLAYYQKLKDIELTTQQNPEQNSGVANAA